MKDAAENKTKEHDKVIKILVSKLFLDPTLVGQAIVDARAILFDTFCKEYSYFSLHMKKICSPDMWIVAKRPGALAHVRF